MHKPCKGVIAARINPRHIVRHTPPGTTVRGMCGIRLETTTAGDVPAPGCRYSETTASASGLADRERPVSALPMKLGGIRALSRFDPLGGTGLHNFHHLRHWVTSAARPKKRWTWSRSTPDAAERGQSPVPQVPRQEPQGCSSRRTIGPVCQHEDTVFRARKSGESRMRDNDCKGTVCLG